MAERKQVDRSCLSFALGKSSPWLKEKHQAAVVHSIRIAEGKESLRSMAIMCSLKYSAIQ